MAGGEGRAALAVAESKTCANVFSLNSLILRDLEHFLSLMKTG